MSKIDEVKARIEATKAIRVELCPKCGRDTCGCYTSGEFWEMQRRLRAADIEIATAKRELDAKDARIAEMQTLLMRAYFRGAFTEAGTVVQTENERVMALLGGTALTAKPKGDK